MNTIIGIGTVFVMLIFLIFVISSFDYILRQEEEKAPAAPVQEAPKAVAAPVVEETAPKQIWSCRLLLQLQSPCMKKIWLASGDAYVARPIRRKAKSLRRKFSRKLHHYRKRKMYIT